MAELNLTSRQSEVLHAVEVLIERKGYSPSIREIMEEINVTSINSVQKSLDRLRVFGLVEWEPHQNRTLRIVGMPPKTTKVGPY